MECIKEILGALKSSIKVRLTITAFLVAIILLKPWLLTYNGAGFFYDKFGFIVAILSILFSISIVIECMCWVKHGFMNQVNKLKYRKYISKLNGRKWDIVKEMYTSDGKRIELKSIDTDVQELLSRRVICQSSISVVDKLSIVDDLNDPISLFILQPEALKIIEKRINNHS